MQCGQLTVRPVEGEDCSVAVRSTGKRGPVKTPVGALGQTAKWVGPIRARECLDQSESLRDRIVGEQCSHERGTAAAGGTVKQPIAADGQATTRRRSMCELGEGVRQG